MPRLPKRCVTCKYYYSKAGIHVSEGSEVSSGDIFDKYSPQIFWRLCQWKYLINVEKKVAVYVFDHSVHVYWLYGLYEMF